MFGFMIGIASLVGLYWVLSGRGSGGFRGRHRGHGRGIWGGSAGLGGFLRRVFETLDTSPGQEKEIKSAVDEFVAEARALRDELKSSRGEVARVMRGTFFDETSMGELFARQDDGLDKLRRAVVGVLARVHAVLDEDQRKRLAELIERGPFRAFQSQERSHA